MLTKELVGGQSQSARLSFNKPQLSLGSTSEDDSSFSASDEDEAVNVEGSYKCTKEVLNRRSNLFLKFPLLFLRVIFFFLCIILDSRTTETSLRKS